MAIYANIKKSMTFQEVAEYFKRNFENCPFYKYDIIQHKFVCVGSSPCRLTNTCLTPKLYVCRPKRKTYVKPNCFIEFSLF